MIIDVGANIGEFALEVAAKNPSDLVLAIEPISELALKIKKDAIDAGLTNISVVEYAIDEVERFDYINVAEHDDFGVSSLLNFDENKVRSDEYWCNRSDLYFDRKQPVEVKRLDSLLSGLLHNDEKINFIKVDAQGLDLNVLKSLGRYIEILQAGMIEVSVTTDRGLYRSENYDLTIALSWLDSHGFKPYFLKPNDPASNEFNLYFCRKNLVDLSFEIDLSLRDVGLYSDKFFWHLPSRKLENFDEKIHSLKTEVHSLETQVNALNHDLLIAKEVNEQLQKRWFFRLERRIKNVWRA
jgi:FkbM family methyltransferase